ncbi:hypothetical protein QUB47_09305 [Microcoleus sp. AT9_B5]
MLSKGSSATDSLSSDVTDGSKFGNGFAFFGCNIVSGWIGIIYLDGQCERLARGMDRERDARTIYYCMIPT